MPFQIIRNDITKVKADVIVNTANPKPCIGAGTDSAIYAAAGEAQLLEARRQIGDIAPGQAFHTEAFQLNAKYVIHTVGPVWIDGNHGERDILRSCYEKSLRLAADLECESIAFPLISSGIYGFPKDEALQIALSEISRFLMTHEMKVLLVVFGRKALQLSERLVGGIKQYIDDHAERQIRKAEYGEEVEASRLRRNRLRMEEANAAMSLLDAEDYAFPEGKPNRDAVPFEAIATLPDVTGKSLDEVLGGAGETFQQRLLRLIDERGLDDVTVYKKANIGRKVFSSIRCKKDYKPKKKTALAFAIALELDLPTTLDLLSRAEYTFSPSSKFDLIITYFITNKKFNIFEINAALFRYGLQTLGD